MKTETQKFATLEQLTGNYLNQFYGTENYQKHFASPTFFTDGFVAFMDKAECYWLGDVLATELIDTLRETDAEVDTYYVEWVVNEKLSNGVLTCRDYKNKQIWSRKIDFTDCIGGKIKFNAGWHGNRLILCLPSED
jgi:hypothetical protein